MRVTCFVKALVFGRGFVVLKREKSARPAGNVAPPPSGDPTKLPAAILRGAPFGLSSPHCVTARARLRGGVNFAAHLSHGCSFSPSEYTFGGDPLGEFRPLSWKCCYPPSCGFPPKSFPLERGPTISGGNLRHSGTRASEDGAFTAPPCYAACNAPASRKEWRIAGARFVSPRHSYGRRGAQEGSAL